VSILGGFLGTVWTSSGYNDGSVASNRGVITRFNPTIDPGNLNIRGTGARGLYDVQLGLRQPQFTIDMLPTPEEDEAGDSGADWLSNIQDGQTAIAYLHIKFFGSTEGLTFVNVLVNRLSVEARAPENITATIEFWAGANITYPVGVIDWNGSVPNQDWSSGRVTTVYRWLDSILEFGGATESEWWTWRYEVVNNLQRLADVTEGSTRVLVARTRDVTGTITKDLDDFKEWRELANVAAELTRFNVTITLDGTPLLNCSRCMWGRIGGASGAEDLIAKTLPFFATDLTTLTP